MTPANPNLAHGAIALIAHSEDESCSGCHSKSDPLGLALERFDSLGQHRTKENGELIDVTAELSGKKFDGAQGSAHAARKSQGAACVVRNVYAYGTGRAPDKTRSTNISTQRKRHSSASGTDSERSCEQIVLAPEFFRVVAPKAAPTSRRQTKSTIAENASEPTAGA